MQRELADPRRTPQERADEIAQTGKAVVLVGANVHATEIGTNQVMNDLVYQLAVERSPWVDHLLENTIVLLIPSQNPGRATHGRRLVSAKPRHTLRRNHRCRSWTTNTPDTITTATVTC